ncbi:unnamed protein product [Bursaphelenchus okinawaensis]|uniref:Uncharacterized protein n=1 Tax=Bursaphelenchus okinawaensis TaxID=465554 RepID=A0A811KVW0_9BILA|nr:unnamed protein product [Bursaphelenchus okinawaensis]CAG9114144.1 unnamed protein product [Bursaphelenchus okinawaensis]
MQPNGHVDYVVNNLGNDFCGPDSMFNVIHAKDNLVQDQLVNYSFTFARVVSSLMYNKIYVLGTNSTERQALNDALLSVGVVLNGMEIDVKVILMSSARKYCNNVDKLKALEVENGQFNEMMTYNNEQFNEMTSYDNGQFNEMATYDNNQFNKMTSYDNGQFNEMSSFDNGQFNEMLSYSNEQFNEMMTYDNSQFNQLQPNQAVRAHL